MNPEHTRGADILVIEDDAVLGTYIQEQLARLGFCVQLCSNGSQGLEQVRSGHYDLVLMDILLPGINGLEILAHVREQQGVPVILMSALGAETDRIAGFRNGADDYLPKPFSLAELHVRIEAVLRRVALERRHRAVPAMPPRDSRLLVFDEVSFDVCFQSRRAELTRSEYRLLETLWRNSEEVLSKAFLYQHVLQRAYAQHDRSLDMHVSQIRRKLKAIGYSEHEVRTVWGKGYVLSPAVPADA